MFHTYLFSGAEYSKDVDINDEKFTSPIMHQLLKEYTSVIDKDNNKGDIFFFNKDNSTFFTFKDSLIEFRADVSKITEDERRDMDEFVMFMPYVMCMYTARHKRGRGGQREIMERIIEISEETGECFYGIADPFRLNGGTLGYDCRDDWWAFINYDHKRPDNWSDLVKKQCNRLKSYGMVNFELPEYSLTQPFQHHVYVPKSAKEDHKRIIRTLIKESPMECD